MGYHGWIHPVLLDVTKEDTLESVREYTTSLQSLLSALVIPPVSQVEIDNTDQSKSERVFNPSDTANVKAQNNNNINKYPLVALINNAGIAYISPIEAADLSKVEHVLDVNVLGIIRCSQVFLPFLRESAGRIINIGSVAGKIVPPLYGIYSASKFAVEAISDALRLELANFKVAVILLQPGTVQSNIRETTMKHYTFMTEDGNHVNNGNNDKKMKKNVDNTTEGKEKTKRFYQKYADRMEEKAQKLSETAAPTSIVTEKLLEALHSEHPKSRYMMGYLGLKIPISPMIRFINTFIPDYLQDRMKLQS